MLRTSRDPDEKPTFALSRIFIPLAAYLGIFVLFFWGIHGGVGQYWDWSFPYFSDHLDTWFASKSSSWTNTNMGSPLGYASDYFLRFLVSMFSFLPPEIVRYGLLVATFAAGALGVYLIATRHTRSWLAFLLGLAAFINPAMFYKYTAGHFNYMVSLTLFIYLLYFLFYKFNRNLRSAVVVGLLFGLIGFQIQFFVITAIFLGVYFLFNRNQLALKYAGIIIAIPVLLNLVWLSNFLSGATSVAETGAQAAKVSFKALSGSDFLSIFTFSFAKATLLSKFYALYELLWNAALFILLLWLLMREKQKQVFDVILLIFLSLMILMATGLYQTLSLGPLTMFYPMLREVGHFAPIIVLIALILVARLINHSALRWGLTLVLAGSLLIVGVKFQYFSQGYSFAAVREQFSPFKQFADRDTSDYRVLAYPFFDQYSFKNLPKTPPGMLPLKNSGHDSFTAFSPQDYITNIVAPHKFQDSLQYKLLQTYDVDVLRPYNVKYIFDFSHIYESNYERYVPPTVYNNDLSIIKNDKYFFDKLVAANPGKIRRVNDRILEIRDYKPRVESDVSVFSLEKMEHAAESNMFSRQALDEPLDYIANDPEIEPYTTKLTPLFNDPEHMHSNFSDGTFTQNLTAAKGGNAYLYTDRSPETLYYEATRSTLTIFIQSTGTLTLHGQPVYGNTEKRILTEIQTNPHSKYYIGFKDTVVHVQPGQSQRIGIASRDDTIDVFTDGDQKNLITNPSFENGLWQEKVNDCNNYDFESTADIKMRQADQSATEGSHSLELSSSRHDACTYTNLHVDGGDYLFSFDYQSPNAQTASFYLAHDKEDSVLAKGSQTILDDAWHTFRGLVSVPGKGGKAKLYFYAKEQFGVNAINRYDNVSLVRVEALKRIRVPGLASQYEKVGLPKGQTYDFSIQGTGQTFKNLIPNASFEQGAWQKNVSDCRNYDSKGHIAQRINSTDKTDGKQSLVLESVRHDACVRSTININATTKYDLSFDYKGKKGHHYGYAVSYDDPEHTLSRQQLEIKKGDSWQRANIRLQSPARATTATIYLYAFEPANKTPNTILYDNVSLTEQPDFASRFYIVEEPIQTLHVPERTVATQEQEGKKIIRIRGATTPFFLQVSETYHEKWRLMLDNSHTNSGLAGINPSAIGPEAVKHFKLSNYMNSWLVDPKALCEGQGGLRQGCVKQANNTYDIALVAEFTPGRWFGIASTISWATLLGCLLYLAASHGREMPTYQLLSYREWRGIVRRWK